MAMQMLADQTTLFRYIGFAKFMDFVHNKKLYFARADCFDDKYEGSLTVLNYEVGKYITIESNGEASCDGLRKETERIRTSAYISCWSKSEYENMAHWQIFGGHNSVAIRASVGELKKQLVNNAADGAVRFMDRVMEPIRYVDHHNNDQTLAIEMLKDSLTPLKNKNVAFRYEEEVRIIYSHLHHSLAGASFNDVLGKGVYVDIQPNKLIKEIVVSPKADDWFYDLVKQVMAKYNLSGKVEWSRLRIPPYGEVF